MRFRTDPALIRAVLLDAERSSVPIAAARVQIHRNTVWAWRRRADASGGEWPTDLDITRWRELRGARESSRAYRKHRYTRGSGTTIDPTGTQRRLQALYALGWTWDALGTQLGGGRNRAHRIASGHHCTNKGVYLGTAERIAALYEELCMTRPEGWVADRARAAAKRHGWAPPLAWDNIDDPDEQPSATHCAAQLGVDIDAAVVDRILRGDWHLHANHAERLAVLARWSGADNDLERLTGWNIARLRRQMTAQEAAA